VHVDIDRRLEVATFALIVILDHTTLRVVIDHGRKTAIPGEVDIELCRACRGRTDVVDVDLVRLQVIAQEVIPLEDAVLV